MAGKSTLRWAVLGLALAAGLALAPAVLSAKTQPHEPFHLLTEDGKIINPLTGENADQPYSPRQTCGTSNCHNYDQITKGYHFQQGWEKVKDDFNKKKPWVLSDGMMGKF
jgi:hypothetical protein